MPGYTHLQRAQPVTVGHHLLAWVEMLERDLGRFAAARRRPRASPLGAGALAGSTLPLPPPERQLRNSLDAVADRDFALDYLYAVAVCFVHLSRIGEELVLWTTAEFGFARLPEEAATGSSMMPQKLNPDVAELVRGKAGTAIGRLTGLLATVKGLPLAYNRDLQEDKAPGLRGAGRPRAARSRRWTALVRGLELDRERLAAAASDPLLLATDAAEALVRAGMPFRDAHEQVAASVRDGTLRGARRRRPARARARRRARGGRRGARPRSTPCDAAASRRRIHGMSRRILLIAAPLVLAGILAAATLPGGAASAAAEEGGITVQGNASVDTIPTAPSSRSASRARPRPHEPRSRRTRPRCAACSPPLKAAGATEVQTQSVSLSPALRRAEWPCRATSPRTRSRRRSDELAQAGAVIDAAVDRGREPGLRPVARRAATRPSSIAVRSRRPSTMRGRAHRRSRRRPTSRSAGSPRSSRAAARRSPASARPTRRWRPSRRRSSRGRSR